MKITLLAENIQKKLPLVNHAISNKNQLPILSHILLETRDNKLILCGTDLEIGMEVAIPVNIEEEGSTTVPARLFTELISALPQEKITLETKEGSLEIVSKKSKSVLQTMSREEFPTLYEQKGEEIFSIPAETLRKDLVKVVFASSLETTRPALSGVLLRRTAEGFLFVATDGYRLSLKKMDLKLDTSDERSLVVPARVIREVLAFKEDSNIQLFISGKNNQVIFGQDDTILVGRLIEAEFPNFQKIIPSDKSSSIQVDREELLKAVKTCAIFARETANIITFSLQKEKMIVSAKTPSLGENTVEVEATLTGEENEIAFNAKYLLDILSNINEETIVFEMTGPLNSGVFKIANDSSFLHIIMPIRT